MILALFFITDKTICDAACDMSHVCPTGTEYQETCKRIKRFKSWWFWR